VNVNRERKENRVKELSSEFDKNTSFFLIDFKGMSVSRAVELRRKMRENSYTMRVVKNRLVKRALKEEHIGDLLGFFKGPTALAYASENPIGLAKLIKDFSVQHKILNVKAAIVDGQFIPGERFSEIANLPSRDQMIAKFAYLLGYPLTQLARSMKAPVSGFGRLLDQFKAKK